MYMYAPVCECIIILLLWSDACRCVCGWNLSVRVHDFAHSKIMKTYIIYMSMNVRLGHLGKASKDSEEYPVEQVDLTVAC